MKKIVILIGNYCSGKTEIALNMAVKASGEGLRTLVIDLDRINDYFRMSDQIQTLTDRRIELVSPTFAGQGATQTVMPAAVASAFDRAWEVYDIVNVFRPMSETADKILKLKGELEGFARHRVTGFVNNSNLLNYASADDLRRGYDIIREASELSGIPVAHTTGRREYLEQFLADGRDERFIGVPIALETYMHRSWDAFTHGRI